jgi:hypothetical protein
MASEYGPGIDVTMVATVALTRGRVVILDTTYQGQVDVPAGVTSVPFGVAQESVAAGYPVRVRVLGFSVIEANAAFALGDQLSIAATTGRVDTAAATHYPVGQALRAATAQSEVVEAFVNCTLTPRA